MAKFFTTHFRLLKIETNLMYDSKQKSIFTPENLKELKEWNPELLHILSMPFYDLDSNNRPQIDWSLESLIQQTLRVITHIRRLYPENNIVLLGHSLGGSIAVKTLDYIMKEKDFEYLRDRFVGIIVVDVVEGTALKALPHMHQIVKSRYVQKYFISRNFYFINLILISPNFFEP